MFMTRKRGLGSRWLLAALATVLLLSGTTVANAAVKQDMETLAGQLDNAKLAPGDPDLIQYQQLSDALGGDDPANILGNRGGSSGSSANLAPAAPPGGATTTTGFTNNTVTPIPDGPGGVVSSTIMVTGVDPYLWDLDLTTDITHTFASDLEITLTAPDGSTVTTITTDNGGGNDDVFAGTLWDDFAGDPATDHTYTNLVVATPLIPEGAMGAFIGVDPNGTWTLTITDDAGLDTGNLNSWTLDVTTLPSAPIFTGPTNFANNTPTAIPDGPGGLVTSDIVVGGLDTFLCDVEMTTDITHTFASDLEISLISPAGTVTTITTDNGGGNDNVFAGTLWTDAAGDPASDHTYTNLVVASPLIPEGAMSAFIGENPNGTWTLSVGDDAGLDVGTINSWSLDLTTCVAIPPPPEVIPTLSPLGLAVLLLALALAAFLLMRRRRTA